METLERTISGFKTKDIIDTVKAIKDKPEIAKFKFRATNRWVNGGHNQSTVQGFYGGCA